MNKRLLLFGAILLCFLPAARASTADQAEAFRYAASAWNSFSVSPGTSVVVYKIAQPRRHHACRVREIQPDGLVCSRHFRRDISIPVHDIVAVVRPRDHDDRTLRIWGATGLGLIAAGFFAGPGAPAVWVVGGLVLIGWPAAAMSAGNGPEHDIVLYYAPGPKPTLPLH